MVNTAKSYIWWNLQNVGHSQIQSHNYVKMNNHPPKYDCTVGKKMQQGTTLLCSVHVLKKILSILNLPNVHRYIYSMPVYVCHKNSCDTASAVGLVAYWTLPFLSLLHSSYCSHFFRHHYYSVGKNTLNPVYTYFITLKFLPSTTQVIP